MGLIPDLNDVPDLAPVEDGEYSVRVISAKEVSSDRTGRTGAMLVCQIEGQEAAENLLHKIWFPMEDDDEQKANTMWRMIKETCVGFGLGADGVDEVSEFVGCEANVKLKSSEYEGRVSNEIAAFL